MTLKAQQLTTKCLKTIFVFSLGFFVLTLPWNTGWHMVGDAYALGPYLPWLELVFPLAGLGLWGLFFSQWALGQLRAIHISRWFYLLLFAALLMVSVLMSVHPDSSLGFLSLWLSASLALSLQLKAVFNSAWFWRGYTASLIFSLALWHAFPPFINLELWGLMLGFAVLHWYRLTDNLWCKLALIMGLCASVLYLPVTAALMVFSVLVALGLWLSDYWLLRRKSLWLWGLVLVGLLGGMLYQVAPALMMFEIVSYQTNFKNVGNALHGVGLGQFEWAQFVNQIVFENPQHIKHAPSFLGRWWYENGVLMGPLLICLWLLTLGKDQNVKLRSLIFVGTVLCASQLWTTPSGIMLGAFWFFSREAWPLTNPLSADRTANAPIKRSNRRETV